jgi:tRNA threonylcarbamoyladenosine biosynthesis protein TsaE
VAAAGTRSDVASARRRELLSRSPEETRALAANLAAAAREGDVIALFGDLGAGKTEFAKGFARGLGVEAVVSSPSFVLVAEHMGRLPVFHVDLYRLSGPLEALDGGLADERRAAGVTVIEWADRAGGLLGDHLAIRIEGSGDQPRRIAVETRTDRYRPYLDVLERPA